MKWLDIITLINQSQKFISKSSILEIHPLKTLLNFETKCSNNLESYQMKKVDDLKFILPSKVYKPKGEKTWSQFTKKSSM